MMSRAVKALSLPNRYWQFVRGWRRFAQQSRLEQDDRFQLSWRDRMPALWENSATTVFDAHYIYHTAWATRTVLKLKPARHVDISSTLYFCTTISASVPVNFYDYRPAPISLDGLSCGRADLTQLPFADSSIESLSCMHTIEHVGLGRYGDAIDPIGDLNAAAELTRVVKPGGHLVMVVPVGNPRICFNAHRVYNFAQITKMFERFSIIDTALVTDNGEFHLNPVPEEFDSQAYGCGCFLLHKKIDCDGCSNRVEVTSTLHSA
ncbi:DUF268 domain-containing protein [Methylocystis sp. H4A]|uniref:DUF268 domain-containing protein n=1 Tax=Methylocystis sp. H4A TaxID=2785788 RepID=UPI0018C309D2|nr:DUF268 domain-containing protein [Methylocystis sp. H4A]MBG0799977.1 DUF268 domain-containing protein [Methylocystis sp. H4A]